MSCHVKLWYCVFITFVFCQVLALSSVFCQALALSFEFCQVLCSSFHVLPGLSDVVGPVAQTLTDGYLTPEKVEKLNDIRDKIGLTKEMADRVIKGVQSQNLRKTINVRYSSLSPKFPCCYVNSDCVTHQIA